MKIILFLNLIMNLNKNIINDYVEKVSMVYKYQEMKEVRYIYFYDIDNFDINSIEIYAGNNKLKFQYQFFDYYKIDLENYYPLDCLKIKTNNLRFSVKFSNNDFYDSCYGYTVINNDKEEITIADLVIDKPDWSKIRYSNKKMNASKTIKLVD